MLGIALAITTVGVGAFFWVQQESASTTAASSKTNSSTGSSSSQYSQNTQTFPDELTEESLIPTDADPTQVGAVTAPTQSNNGQPMNDCQALVSDYSAKVSAENKKYAANQQSIINRYNENGMSFSSLQKSAQQKEFKRHESALKTLTSTYSKQQKSLGC